MKKSIDFIISSEVHGVVCDKMTPGMLKKFISKVSRAAQFKFNLGGKLFLEHITASIFLSVASIAAVSFIPGPIFGLFAGLFLLLKTMGVNFLDTIATAVFFTLIGLLVLSVPLFLLARLVLVFKKDGVQAFLGALVGELIIVIPFIRLLYLLTKLFYGLLA